MDRASVDRVRRAASMRLDRLWASGLKRLTPRQAPHPLDRGVRAALLIVTFSTTPYLKLLLRTLVEQRDLDLLTRIVIVDNGSRDDGRSFLDHLAAAVPRLHVVHRRSRLSHGVGMRAAVRALGRIELSAGDPANVLVFCDADVVFRDPRALRTLLGAIDAGAVLAGEVRTGANTQPDIQASLFAVRRDVLARGDVAPIVHDGAPAYRMQRSIWDLGLTVGHVPMNHGGLTLHRGRSGVAAAARLHPRHQYAQVANQQPHYMGVPGGAAIWEEIETRHAALLSPAAEAELVELLTRGLEGLGHAG